MRRKGIVEGLVRHARTFCLVLLLLLQPSLLLVVVGSNLLTLYFLHFGHEAQHLRAAFGVGGVEEHRVLRFGHFVEILFSGGIEEEMQVGFGEGIEIVREAGRWLQEADNLLISPAGDHVDHIVFHPQRAYSVDVVAVDLCS